MSKQTFIAKVDADIEDLKSRFFEMCGSCDGCDFCEYTPEGCQLNFFYNQGRADAINEFITRMLQEDVLGYVERELDHPNYTDSLLFLQKVANKEIVLKEFMRNGSSQMKEIYIIFEVKIFEYVRTEEIVAITDDEKKAIEYCIKNGSRYSYRKIMQV